MSNTDEIDLSTALADTLEDRKLSRGERRALAEVLAASLDSDAALSAALAKAFELARAEVIDPSSHAVLDWLYDVAKTIVASRAADSSAPRGVEVHFSPGERCALRIASLLRTAQRSVDICVFTITDDRISRAIAEAHQRRVAVRIVTDDEKAYDPGSDVMGLARLGIPVRVDASPFHMHHKFAIFDGRLVLTGSYNWTRGAAENNEENFVIFESAPLVRDFQGEFDRLWSRFSANVVTA